MFATASSDHTIKVWDYKKLQVEKTLRGHTDDVLSI